MIIEADKLIKLITPCETGWREMSAEDYHADKSAVNFSSLKHMEKSPNAFARSYWSDDNKDTKAMRFGSKAHMASLEGEKFKSLYQVEPIFTGRTKQGEVTTSKLSTDVKNQYANWLSNLPQGAVVVTQEEQTDIFNIIESILSIEDVKMILSKGKPEVIGYWVDPETGINCRMMNDYISFNFKVWMDFKTTQDTTWEMFRKSVENLHYDLQVAMYCEGIFQITGIHPEGLYWLAVESKSPYEARLFPINPMYLEIGKMKFRKLMAELKECIDSKNFSQRGINIESPEPSSYYKNKYEFIDHYTTIVPPDREPVILNESFRINENGEINV